MVKRVLRHIYNFFNGHCYVAVLHGWLFTGFGQFYNSQYLKGLLFAIPNYLNNHLGHLNEAILYSFTGDIEKSKLVLNYQWILNYPSFFSYAHWDAYKSGYIRDKNEKPPISHSIPFILSAMFATVGITYGRKNYIGPVFTGLEFYFIGLFVGIIIVKISNILNKD
ncbi:hypothetical protein PU629_02540 [Pullulanibacillus sp. KACC 23026]|uniref:hypothetical protein n=1 Tax=Pullulanibacillus sp. KACC 23026 TaxID=3028315 RepID=UPI0023AE78BD|nr:hypothetical protein [Pullulanibacillus sp. KACC 23026]WEG13263.1 hypothetical protein PU629_02540 [Pullulanibacillus sp. KACC 23026]